MKAQIEEILKDNLSISQCGYMNSQAGLDGVNETAEVIEQLMCYREVKALCNWADPSSSVIETFQHEIIEQLKRDYPEDMITAAINRFKSESQ